jgi:hypothetical protein
MSGFAEAKRAGFALAAVLANDRALLAVRSQLEPHQLAPIAALCARDDKPALIASLLHAVRPQLSDTAHLQEALPPRLCAMLAQKLPRAAARALSASAPLARPSFAPAADLLPRLLRIARRSIASEVEARGAPARESGMEPS